MIRRIYLDLDGTLNRLIMHALEVNQCGVSRYDDAAYPLLGNYDIVAAANALLSRVGRVVTTAEFWGNVTRDVWARTPPSAELSLLLEWSKYRVGRDNVTFLTAPTSCPDSAAGKMEWLTRYVPDMARQFLIGPADQKPGVAQPGHLLIDDSDENVAAFRAHGGRAILVPRPWNKYHAHAKKTLPTLRFLLKAYEQTLFGRYRNLGLIPRSL